MAGSGQASLVRSRSGEHAEQALLIAWARTYAAAYPELRWLFAIPNGAKLPYRKNGRGERYSPEAAKLRAEGLLPGVVDLCLPVPNGAHHGLWIEMKWGSNKPTPEQAEFLRAMNRYGYRAVVCYSFEEARRAIVDYLGLPAHLLTE